MDVLKRHARLGVLVGNAAEDRVRIGRLGALGPRHRPDSDGAQLLAEAEKRLAEEGVR